MVIAISGIINGNKGKRSGQMILRVFLITTNIKIAPTQCGILLSRALIGFRRAAPGPDGASPPPPPWAPLTKRILMSRKSPLT
jgi:hypothetical protein